MEWQYPAARSDFNEATESRYLMYIREVLSPQEFLGFLKGSLVRSAQDEEPRHRGQAMRRSAFFSRELQLLAGPGDRRSVRELRALLPVAFANTQGSCTYAEASAMSGLTPLHIKNLVYKGRIQGGAGQVQVASLVEYSAASKRSGFAKSMAIGEELITYRTAAELLGRNYAYVADSVRRGRLHGGGGLVFKASVDNMRNDPRWIGNRNRIAA